MIDSPARLTVGGGPAGTPASATKLVIPTGYAFNLDGTSIYLALSTLFLANVYGVPMGLPEQMGLLVIMLLTPKGAATVSGGSFVVFASTVAATGLLPMEGVAILFGVYRVMSMAIATCNTIGNVVATVVDRVTGDLDRERFKEALAHPSTLEDDEGDPASITIQPTSHPLAAANSVAPSAPAPHDTTGIVSATITTTTRSNS